MGLLGSGLLLLLMGSTSLMAQVTDPFPDVSPNTFYGSMIISVKTVLNKEVLTQDVIVAVYADDQIRGKGRPEDSTNPGVTYLTVYGNKTGEHLTFKVFVNGEIIEADRGITYTFNGVLGSPQSPYVLDLTPLPSFTGITVKYSEGKRIAVFDGTSEETISIPESFDVDSVEYDRYFVPNQYAAVILPFDINSSTNFTGGSFFKFTDVIRENEKWVATMTKVNELKANLPYLFLPSDEQLVFDFNGQPVMLKTEVVDPGSKNGWTFRGTYQKLVWTDESTDYGFSARNPDDNIKREFVRFSDGDYILPLRCYLSYTGPYVPFSARRYAEPINLPDIVEIRLLDENGNPYGGVGIGSIYIEHSTLNIEHSVDAVYDLAGRRVQGFKSSSINHKPSTVNGKQKKGIFVVNGKKMFADGF
ncbi:MAG: hypothetical protein IJR69_05035 [Bacteroidaceae bacterium]|nr:hypothetical protein [Bacteroidaceae bacterium]